MGIFYELFGPSVKKLRKKKDVQGLIKVLEKKLFAKARIDAVWALGQIGDSRMIEPLCVALKDDDKDVQFEAIKILVEKGDPRTTEPFIETLKHEVKYMREYAKKGLGKFGDVRALRPLLWLHKYDVEAERSIYKVLRRIKDTEDLKHVQQILMDKSIDLSDDMKDAFRTTLIEVGWEPESKTMKARLLIKKGAWELDEMVSLGEAAFNPLKQAMRKKYPELLEMKAFAVLGGKRAIKPLMTKLRGNCGYSAAEALGMIRNWSSEELELLINALNANNADVRDSAAKALGMIGDLRSAEAVIDMLFKFEKHSSFAIKEDGFALEGQFKKHKMKNLFGSYSRHIINSSLGFTVRTEFGHFGTRYIWTVNKSNKAVEDLCNNPTQISNNILIKVRDRKKITVHDHEPDEPFGTVKPSEFKELDLSKQKMMAKKELEKRGNPPYEPSVYLDKKEWKL